MNYHNQANAVLDSLINGQFTQARQQARGISAIRLINAWCTDGMEEKEAIEWANKAKRTA